MFNATIAPPYGELMTYLVPIDDLSCQILRLEKANYKVYDIRLANENGECFWITAIRIREYAANLLNQSDLEGNVDSDSDSLENITWDEDAIESIRKRTNTPENNKDSVAFIWNETKKDFEVRK